FPPSQALTLSTEAFLNFCEMTRSMQICPRMDGRRAYWRRKIFRVRSSRATRLMALSSNRSSATTRSAALLAAPLSRTSCYPLPQSDSVGGGNNFFFNSGNTINTDQGDLKIDYSVSDKDHIFGRWSQMHLRNPTFSGCLFCAAGAAQGADQPIRNAVVDWTHAFNPNLLNEARIGF